MIALIAYIPITGRENFDLPMTAVLVRFLDCVLVQFISVQVSTIGREVDNRNHWVYCRIDWAI